MDNAKAGRRGFFKVVAIGGAVAAAAVATTIVGERRSATATNVDEAPKPAGYRETAHIRHYYRTTQV
jgi:hypothetical protein